MENKKNIVLIGMPGCGKSTLGILLAQQIGYEFIDIDTQIEKKFDKIDNLFLIGEDYFRQKETIVVKEVAAKNKAVIATGGGIVTRYENIKALKHNATIVFIDMPLDKIKNNIDWLKRPLLKDDQSKLDVLYNQRFNLYDKYCDIKITVDGTVSQTLDKLLLALKEVL